MSDLVGNPKDRFSHNEAQILSVFVAVCPQTEATVYPDSFFEAQDLIVNALDNVEARRYVDR